MLWLFAAQGIAGDIVLVIHGGAGAPARSELTAQKEAAVRAELTKALRAGFAVISKGGTALDAVTAPIVILEDSPLFNAGRGAALNAEGKAELDAAIMEGNTLRAGAVAGLHRVRNPIRLARAVMEQSPHVMMIGDGAEQFGRSVGIEMVDPSWFITPERQRDLEKVKAAEKQKKGAALPARFYMGTVGAVALDSKGHIAPRPPRAARPTSATAASGTPRSSAPAPGPTAVAAFRPPARGSFSSGSARPAKSAPEWSTSTKASRPRRRQALREVAKLGGDGGVIALDSKGNVAMPFNTDGMYRGTVTRSGKIRIEIYRGQDLSRDPATH